MLAAEADARDSLTIGAGAPRGSRRRR
jgi:hypothetical protein